MPPGVWLTEARGETRNGTGPAEGGDPEGFTVSRLLCEMPLYVAVILAVEIAKTEELVATKTALLKPGATVTVSGT